MVELVVWKSFTGEAGAADLETVCSVAAGGTISSKPSGRCGIGCCWPRVGTPSDGGRRSARAWKRSAAAGAEGGAELAGAGAGASAEVRAGARGALGVGESRRTGAPGEKREF